MMLQRRPSSDPLWRDEFSVETAKERYVTRRQFSKFLVLTSFGMLAGNLWILIRSLRYRPSVYPAIPVARLGEIPVGGVKQFRYPAAEDTCLMVRTGPTGTLLTARNARIFPARSSTLKPTIVWNVLVTTATSQWKTDACCKAHLHAPCLR